MPEEAASAPRQQAGQLQWPGDASDDDSGSQHSSQSDWEESQGKESENGASASLMDAPPGSIASTYWRPERSDRKNLLATVDEQCVLLASPLPSQSWWSGRQAAFLAASVLLRHKEWASSIGTARDTPQLLVRSYRCTYKLFDRHASLLKAE